MILNNFENLLFSSMTGANKIITLINGSTSAYGYAPVIGYSGNTPSSFQYAGGNTTTASSGTNVNYTAYAYYSLTFGSGTTEPTADDYQMESPYDTTDHFSWKTIAATYVADSLTKVITASIANISEEDLTVSEIGVVIAPPSTAYNDILISRSLITPVTIEPNETKTFQYTLDLSGLAG